MDSKRILAIFAHPDDEYAFAGLVTKLINANHEVAFICATKGEAGRIRNIKSGLNIQDGLSRIREKEFMNACEHLKITQYYFLDLPDNDSAHWNKARSIENILDIASAFKPTHLISFDKFGGNGHPDHKEISSITQEVQNRLTNTEFLQITKFPVSFVKKKLCWLPNKIKSKVATKICRTDLDHYKLIKLNNAELKAKLKLVDIYKSQFPNDVVQQII